MEKETVKKSTFMEKLTGVLVPVGNVMANQKHLSSISSGIMATAGLTLLAAVFQIIANPPVTAEMLEGNGILRAVFGGWFNFATANRTAILMPYNMTIGLMGLLASLTIAYNLAKKYDMAPLSNGIVSMCVFSLVAAPATIYKLADEASVTALPNRYMGAMGLFTSILVALVTVEVARFCSEHHIEIKLPDSVPPFLGASFSALIPLVFDIIIFYGTSLVLGKFELTIPTAINALLSKPLSVVNSAPGVILMITFSALLWCCGIHGTAIVYPFVLPILMEAVTNNAALVAAGESPVISPIFIWSAVAMVGGSGNTLGVVILAAFKAKSKQLKAIGRMGIIPGFFNINEPVLFGLPIMFNPILMIPYIFGTTIMGILVWIGLNIGLYVPQSVYVGAALPIGVLGMLETMSVRTLIFQFAMIPVTMLIWYPFFKIYDNQLTEKEAAAEAAKE